MLTAPPQAFPPLAGAADGSRVEPAKGFCRTAQADGYFLEGHVPALDAKRVLVESPEATAFPCPAC